MSVVIKELGFIRPGESGSALFRKGLDSDIYSLNINRKDLDFKIISRNFLRSLEFDAKSLMSIQTQLAMIAVQECFRNLSKDFFKNKSVVIYIVNGHISLDDLTIKILKKLSITDDKCINFDLLNKNLDRIPPLDGIKMLSTALTHFIAREYDIHGVGHQIYCGETTGLQAIIESYELLNNSVYDLAIVVGSYAPFQNNSLPFYLYQELHHDAISPLAECGCALILERSPVEGTSFLAKVSNYKSGYQKRNEKYIRSIFGTLTPFMELADSIKNYHGLNKKITLTSLDYTGYSANVDLEVS